PTDVPLSADLEHALRVIAWAERTLTDGPGLSIREWLRVLIAADAVPRGEDPREQWARSTAYAALSPYGLGGSLARLNLDTARSLLQGEATTGGVLSLTTVDLYVVLLRAAGHRPPSQPPLLAASYRDRALGIDSEAEEDPPARSSTPHLDRFGR